MLIDLDSHWLLISCRTIRRDRHIFTAGEINRYGQLADRLFSCATFRSIVGSLRITAPQRGSRLATIFNPILHLVTKRIPKRPYTNQTQTSYHRPNHIQTLHSFAYPMLHSLNVPSQSV